MEKIITTNYEKTSLIFRMKNLKGQEFVPYWEYEEHPEYIEIVLLVDYPHKIEKELRNFRSREEFIIDQSFKIAHLLRLKGIKITPTFNNKENIKLFLETGEIYYIENGKKKEALFPSEEEIKRIIIAFCNNFESLSKFYEKEKLMGPDYQSIFGNDEKLILDMKDKIIFRKEYRIYDMYEHLINSNRYYSLYRYLIEGHLDDDSLIDLPYQELSLVQEEIENDLVLVKEKTYTAPYADN